LALTARRTLPARFAVVRAFALTRRFDFETFLDLIAIVRTFLFLLKDPATNREFENYIVFHRD